MKPAAKPAAPPRQLAAREPPRSLARCSDRRGYRKLLHLGIQEPLEQLLLDEEVGPAPVEMLPLPPIR